MNEQFVIVTSERKGYGDETLFHFADSATDALVRIAKLNNRPQVDGSVQIERVFKFDAIGNVAHYHMVLDGFTPKLEPIPTQPKRG